MRRRSTFGAAIALFLFTVLAPGVSAAPAYVGAVYAELNSPAGAQVLVWGREKDGGLTYAASVPTNGLGTGASLGDQGAVTLSDDGRWLYAVNAGSNTVTGFHVSDRGTDLDFASIVASGGVMPVSVTARGRYVYVLNAGGSGNIAGFERSPNGSLTPIPGSVQPLSAVAAAAAQIQFSPDGRSLVVTEKATNRIDVFPVQNGVAGAPTVIVSAGSTPYGFDFTPNGIAVVSEAATGSASSYLVRGGSASFRAGPVSDLQAAPCWFVVTKNGRFAYTTNAASGTISGYAVSPDGALALLDASGVTATTGAGATDEAVDRSSKFLYARMGSGEIDIFAIGNDGSLLALPSVTGLPAGLVGLAAQ